MERIRIKRIVGKKRIATLLQNLADAFASPVSVKDGAGRLVFGPGTGKESVPLVSLDGEGIGAVIGTVPAVNMAASALNCVIAMEQEKNLLSNEMLTQYNELAVLYDITPRIRNLLAEQGEQAVAGQVMDWLQSLFQCDSGVFLLKCDNEAPHAVEAFGTPDNAAPCLEQAMGFVQDCIEQARGDIVNDAAQDFRFESKGPTDASSFLCAPLLAEDETLGALLLCTNSPEAYMARDIKLLQSIAGQTSLALQNHRRGKPTSRAATPRGPAQSE